MAYIRKIAGNLYKYESKREGDTVRSIYLGRAGEYAYDYSDLAPDEEFDEAENEPEEEWVCPMDEPGYQEFDVPPEQPEPVQTHLCEF